jgi:hypothetical protein
MSKYRLFFKQVDIKAIDNELLQVLVTLEGPKKSFIGVSSARGGKELEMRLAIEATLDAITQAITRPIKFYLSSVAIKEIGESQKRFVVVLLKTDYFIEPVGEAIELLGACQLSSSETEAAVRAVLDATNRTVSQLLR